MMAGKKRTVIKETSRLLFVRQERPGKKTWFEIHFKQWYSRSATWEEADEQVKELDELFGSKGGSKARPSDLIWNFWKYEVADELFTLATLKYT
jgi:uncharacterized protein with von Willebrand factor type A (vWA) domain